MKLEKRQRLTLDKHPSSKRSFGFHAKQRPHPPKVQHPKRGKAA